MQKEQRQPLSMRSLVLLLMTTLAVRLAATLVYWNDFHQDPDAYLALAQSWSSTGIYGLTQADGITHPTAFRPPLLPWLLSWGFSLQVDAKVWMAAMQIGFALGTVYCVLEILPRLRYSFSPMVNWALPMLIAIDPILLRQSTLIMTESLAVFLAMATWLLALKTCYGELDSAPPSSHSSWRKNGLLGIALGLGVLCRPTSLVWGLLLVLFSAVSTRKRGWGRIRPGLAILFGMSLLVVPWTIRNWMCLGHPVVLTTHGGYTLLLANNESIYDHMEQTGPSRHWDASTFHREWAGREKMSETSDDAYAQQLAWRSIRSRPMTFIKSCLYRMGWLWAWWPSEGPTVMKVAIGIWYGIWSTLGFLGIGSVFFRSQTNGDAWVRTTFLPALLLLVSLTAVHALYWSNMRMRAPVQPIVYIFAMAGLPVRSRISNR